MWNAAAPHVIVYGDLEVLALLFAHDAAVERTDRIGRHLLNGPFPHDVHVQQHGASEVAGRT